MRTYNLGESPTGAVYELSGVTLLALQSTQFSSFLKP